MKRSLTNAAVVSIGITISIGVGLLVGLGLEFVNNLLPQGVAIILDATIMTSIIIVGRPVTLVVFKRLGWF